MSINVVLDHAGSLTYVTDAPDMLSAMETAAKNPRIPSVNVSYVAQDHMGVPYSVEELEANSPYPVTEIAYAELEGYERSGCQYDECHNYLFGPEYKSENYCDEHAGPVKDEYADVTVIWEGAIDSYDTCYEREQVLKIVQDTIEAVIDARERGTMNEEIGVKVEASFHTHEFDTRDAYDAFDGNCFCESYDTEYDSHKDEPGENGRLELEEVKA